MTEFFITVVNMSISASWIVLTVLLFRALMKKAPGWINVLLWGVVGVRLISPFSFESVLSLIPSKQTINPEVALNPPAINSGVGLIDNVINPIIGEATVAFQPEKDLNLFQFIMPYLAGLWYIGIAALLIYTLISYLKLKNKIGTAVLLRDNIYQSENVASPFVLGILKPKIYLPFNMTGQNTELVIAHENAHIRRKDHLWKPLGFLILTLHWFNPLMWLGYVLLCRDIELACDEKVIKELNNEKRADYSEALLNCSVNRKMIAACPLAFGESGVKKRVKSVLSYKKPALCIIVIAVILCIVLAVGFLTNPVSTSVFGTKFETGKCLFSDVVSEDKETRLNNLIFDITEDGVVYKTFDDGTTEVIGNLENSDYTSENLKEALAEQGKNLNLGKIKNAYRVYSLNGNYVILQKNSGTVYLVSFFSDGKVMDVFKLKKIADTEFTKDKLYYPESGSELDGISMGIVSSDFSGEDPYIKIRWKNNTSHKVMFGETFMLYYNDSDEWKSCDTWEERFWLLPAYMIMPDTKTDKIYKLNGYDLSKPGRYRFEAKCSIDGQNDSSYKVWIDFKIKANNQLSFSNTKDVTVPSSTLTTYTMDCIINEIEGNHFIVEKLADSKKSGVLYQFNYNSAGFEIGEKISIEYKYPIAETFPYGLTDVNIKKLP
ncbi:MAG: hypothetical protein II237_10990 [Clostridia bacterium]|nr:hypothetical protein [Clostridia bacterium]